MAEVAFAIPGDLSTPTGGYAYDRQVLARLPACGIKVRQLALPGSFPAPSRDDLDETLRLIEELAPGTILLVDGLAYGALPADVVARITHPIVALVHHPLGLESGIPKADALRLVETETAALARAGAIVVTSRTTARLLATDFGVPRHRIHVAEPGTEPARRSPGNQLGRVRVLAVGSVVRRKGYDVLIEALAGIRDLSWDMAIVGADDRSTEHALEIRNLISRNGLEGRIVLTGAVDDAALDRHYADADLFVLASRFEGFGMVLTEALARGLPIITTTGGAAAETVSDRAAVKVPPEDAAALREALRQLITDPEARHRLADAAWHEGQALTRWDETTRLIAEVLRENGA